MQTPGTQPARDELIALETRFWQALVDEDADTATGLLDEPSVLVSTHGAMKFDHADYRRMAEQGSMVVKSFDLSDMDVVFPDADTALLTYHASQEVAYRGSQEQTRQEMLDTSVWLRKGGQWRCVLHTETPAGDEEP